jgi:hypothetical protein
LIGRSSPSPVSNSGAARANLIPRTLILIWETSGKNGRNLPFHAYVTENAVICEQSRGAAIPGRVTVIGPVASGKLRPEQLHDFRLDLIVLGKTVERMLGKNLPPIEKDFEGAGIAWGDRYAAKVLVIIVQQVLRQTGGSREVASGGAVFDPDRRFLLGRRRAGHGVSSVPHAFLM